MSDLASLVQYFEQLEAGKLDGRADSWSFAATVLALRAGGQHQRVLDLYHRMQAGGYPIYKDVYHAALEACERLGLWQEGRQVLHDIQVQPQFPNWKATLRHDHMVVCFVCDIEWRGRR